MVQATYSTAITRDPPPRPRRVPSAGLVFCIGANRERCRSARSYGGASGATEDAGRWRVLQFGGRDGSRGWRSPQPHEFPPFYAWPPRPAAVLRWLFGFPGYLWPVNATWLVIALVTWFFLTPDLASMRSLAPGWIAFVFLRNLH